MERVFSVNQALAETLKGKVELEITHQGYMTLM